LVDALENLKKKAGSGGRPSDEDLAEFQKALGDLKKMGNFGANKPEDKEQMAYEQLKDSLGYLKKKVPKKETKIKFLNTFVKLSRMPKI